MEMRVFLITCLLGLALSAPQGYNYQQSSRLQLPTIPQIGSFSPPQLLQQAVQAPHVQQALSGPSGVGSAVSYSGLPQQVVYQQQPSNNFGYNTLPQHQQQLQQTYNPSAGAALVSKDIYVHVPPADEAEEQYAQPQLPVAPPRKHYRIVFIKAPAPNVQKAALRVKQAPVEEKTIIYVLTKKADPLDLQAALEQAAPKPPSKPEVFFIKYKTQEEAAHAQRTIQAQYDQLGGTTQISDEGIAPVTSVIGSLDHQNGAGVAIGGGSNIGGLPSAIPNKYLPANLRA